MSCFERQIDISAYLDGALDQSQQSDLLGHLEGCQHCRSFYDEHRQFDLFLTEVSKEVEPPLHIWNRIETEIRRDTGNRNWWTDFRAHFEIPQLAYGFAALLLFGLASIFALQVYDEFSAHPDYLAELDSFSVDIQSNPFLNEEGESLENPFLDSIVSNELVEKMNPFERYDEVMR